MPRYIIIILSIITVYTVAVLGTAGPGTEKIRGALV